jgi:hypothetical protein
MFPLAISSFEWGRGEADAQYYKDKTTGEQKPGSKGISLTKEQVRFSTSLNVMRKSQQADG